MKKLLVLPADMMILAGAIKRMTVVALGVVLLAACGNSAGGGGAPAPVGKDPSEGKAPGGPAGVPDGSAGAATTDGAPVTMLSYITLKEYPHDTTAYTEGLLIRDKELYESTGHPSELPSTRSLFGVVDWATGKIKTRVELDKDRYFGEGITFLGNKVYQLTYTTDTGFIYDAKTFQRLGIFRFPGKEGWGMTTDEVSLILSDGSSTLWYLNPQTFATRRTLQVTENGILADRLNELEVIKGYIYANVYTKNYIVKIDPATGHVVARLDLSSLADAARNKYPGSMEMNGIAWDSLSGIVYVTGKMWPSIYAIRFP